MCVGFWTLEHPEYALIMCANRDEFIARPTRPAAFHSFGSSENDESGSGRVLSGRDVSAGGTWLGIAPSTGRVAFLTNITETPQTLPSSRGALVPLFLLADPKTPLETLYPPSAQYAGFNLLMLAAAHDEEGKVHFPDPQLLTNNGARGPLVVRALHRAERTAGGLSNAAEAAGGPPWPKVSSGLPLFAAALKDFKGDADGLADALFALLRTEAPGPHTRATLRNTICVPPVNRDDAVKGGAYATRVATVLLVRRDGAALFVERDVWRAGSNPGELELAPPGDGERRYQFQVGVGRGG